MCYHDAINPPEPLLGCVYCCLCVPLCLSVLLVFASVWLAGCLGGCLAGWWPGCLAVLLAGSLCVCCIACSLLVSRLLVVGLAACMCRSAWLLGFLAACLASWAGLSAAWLWLFCMILPLPACMCLCLCLAYAFANCESEFDFSDLSGWKSYVPIISDFACFCLWLLSCLQCTMYMYGCGYDFSTFHFRFFFLIFFGGLCVGPQTLPKSSFMRGDSLFVMKKRSY